jgi:hypothetical protein
VDSHSHLGGGAALTVTELALQDVPFVARAGVAAVVHPGSLLYRRQPE